jgi:prepilin-type N-terminal cleavage/methylation domain-containing protein
MRATRDSGQRGFTLIEVMIAAAVIAVGVLGSISAMSSTLQLATNSRESQIAIAGARQELEIIRDYAANCTTTAQFTLVYSLYNNQTFSVRGLAVPSGMSQCGSVAFLTETQTGAALGYPGGLDLNGNGTTNDSPSAVTFNAYGVTATVAWTSETGSTSAQRLRTIQLTTVISNAE